MQRYILKLNFSTPLLRTVNFKSYSLIILFTENFFRNICEIIKNSFYKKCFISIYLYNSYLRILIMCLTYVDTWNDFKYRVLSTAVLDAHLKKNHNLEIWFFGNFAILNTTIKSSNLGIQRQFCESFFPLTSLNI